MLSPTLRSWIANLSASTAPIQTPPDLARRIDMMVAALKRVRHNLDGSDLVWILWLTTERGKPADWASYAELKEWGDVATHAEYRELWLMEFPERVQWWRFRASFYHDRLYVSLGDKVSFSYGTTDKTIDGFGLRTTDEKRFLRWLSNAVVREVRLMLQDSKAYRRGLEKSLPYRHRFGVVQRHVLWRAIPDTYRPDLELGAAAIDAFSRLVSRIPPSMTHRELTADDFFRFCAIAYAANDYSERIHPRMKPRDQYRAMADGRDEGLLRVTPNDPRAFDQWVRKRVGGGHPFEICRGGNSTHITLAVVRVKGGWQLILEGGSTNRMVEAARMALALDKKRVPFVLHRGQEMLLKLRGEDHIGVVPKDFHGGYASCLFPEREDVFDATTIDHLDDAWRRVKNRVIWRPIEVTCEPTR